MDLFTSGALALIFEKKTTRAMSWRGCSQVKKKKKAENVGELLWEIDAETRPLTDHGRR